MRYSDVVMTPAEMAAVRYSLVKDGCQPLIVIGFNPSTADAVSSDRTMESVVRLADFNGYDGFAMLNVYPLRSTSPEALPFEVDEVLHRSNMRHLNEILGRYPDADVLLAYGDLVDKRPYTRRIADEIIALLRASGRNILCIRRLKSGNPKHPLYTKSTTRFTPFL